MSLRFLLIILAFWRVGGSISAQSGSLPDTSGLSAEVLKQDSTGGNIAAHQPENQVSAPYFDRPNKVSSGKTGPYRSPLVTRPKIRISLVDQQHRKLSISPPNTETPRTTQK